jgi:uncharacterized protein
VKLLNFAILAAAAFALAAPTAASAQLNSSPGEDFVNAVRSNDGDKVTSLLRDHPPALLVNARAGDGDTALIIAINRRDEDWTGFLLNEGADVNLPGKSGDTPLIAAARIGFDDAVGWLLGLGAKIDAPNRHGETALIAAVQARQVETVRALLQGGADPDKTDSVQGFSARQYAERDPRARNILQLINSKKPTGSPAK